MKETEIPKSYESQTYEDALYRRWEASGFFNPDTLPGKRPKSFTISMPPPNATGVLHVGHAVMLAIQDLVIRFQRMRGKKTLWLPGTDHAAIATQAKVEKLLKEKENKTRQDLGRDQFLARVGQFVDQSRHTIRTQVRKMGSSCDWSRERFTLDQGLNEAVTEAFVRMYQDGLIYRGVRIVNWCPHCGSTLADDEVEYRETRAPFYYFKYGPVVIGTARPETKFGDKVIVVHPDDPRYRDLVGKEMEVEWILGPIKARVIADPVVDMALGSGAMTITPGHSFVDFELAQKYQISIEKIIDEQGKLTDAAGPLVGLPVAAARQKVVKLLQTKGLVDHVDENYVHNLSVCYRCGTPVEPLPSEQWFVNVNKPIKKLGNKSLKDRALAAVKDGEIGIIPDRFNKVYFHWLENLRDWCISRQIWYGHRIPVWYKVGKGRIANGELAKEIYVGGQPPKGEDWEQDPDTLDTWFSSGLWTFSTLGWPNKTKDLKTFHPTDLMETGYDILFFWVARMIIMSTYLVDDVPFRHVYLHGLVRDDQGRKMSKSLDNIIDPLDVIKKFGADATRLSLIIGTTPGNDSNLSESKIGGYRNFVNKLWNIARYILISVKQPRVVEKPPAPKTLADRWILAELNELIATTTKQLEAYNFSAAGEKIYEFTWSKLADWYVEVAKVEKDKDEILLFILQALLKLWHPFTPFVTEAIWERLGTKALLMVAPWPAYAKASAGKPAAGKADQKAMAEFTLVQAAVSAIRNLRATSNIGPAKRLRAVILAGKQKPLLVDAAPIIKSLARLDQLEIIDKGAKPAQALSAVVGGLQIYLPVAELLDVAKETARLKQEAERIATFITHLEDKLTNQRFLDRAPRAIIATEQEKLALNREQLQAIKQQLDSLR